MKTFFRRAAAALSLLSAGLPAAAQMTYNFSASTAVYAPLPATATPLRSGQVWDDATIFSAPLGFSFRLDGKATSRFWMEGTNGFMSDSTGTVSGFTFLSTSNVDRGRYGSTPQSPVRYQTSGAAPNRIFKLELRNMGFTDEHALYGTTSDSISLQIWLYETSNAVEFRYGPSHVAHFSDYFDIGPVVGLGKGINLATQVFDKSYVLNGSPANPVVDSVTMSNFSKGLNAIPAAGTVYRFTPKNNSSTAVHESGLQASVRLFPTPCGNTLSVQAAEALRYEVVSAIGSSLLSGTAPAGTSLLDLSGLPAGTYLVRLSAGGEQDVRRIVKQ